MSETLTGSSDKDEVSDGGEEMSVVMHATDDEMKSEVSASAPDSSGSAGRSSLTSHQRRKKSSQTRITITDSETEVTRTLDELSKEEMIREEDTSSGESDDSEEDDSEYDDSEDVSESGSIGGDSIMDLEKELKDAFLLFDEDNDGEITMVELKKVMDSLSMAVSEIEVETMIKEIDADGNGVIDFEEFKQMMKDKLSSQNNDEEIRRAFDLFDKDKDGKISPVELMEVMISFGEEVTEEDINEMIAEADVDGDGYIQFEEFKKLLLGG